MIISILLFLFAATLAIGLSALALVHLIVDSIRYRSSSLIRDRFFDGAYYLDLYGNATYGPLLNAYFLKRAGYAFGRGGETISSALGKNWTLGKLTFLGVGCVGLLNLLDKDHCYKYIEKEWHEWHLPQPDRVSWWATACFSLVLLCLLATIICFTWWILF